MENVALHSLCCTLPQHWFVELIHTGVIYYPGTTYALRINRAIISGRMVIEFHLTYITKHLLHGFALKLFYVTCDVIVADDGRACAHAQQSILVEFVVDTIDDAHTVSQHSILIRKPCIALR